eukprot:984798-Pelagomonas_calceolata.AAC.3
MSPSSRIARFCDGQDAEGPAAAAAAAAAALPSSWADATCPPLHAAAAAAAASPVAQGLSADALAFHPVAAASLCFLRFLPEHS